MLITRATRHDNDDLEVFYSKNEWEDPHLADGVAFVAREGSIAGALTVIEIDPQTIVIEDVLVAPERRGKGLGAQLLQTAMNSRGGTVFLCCHSERLGFYGRLGFKDVPFDQLPEGVQGFMRDNDAYPFTEDHVHYFMKAR
jgi:N-acetylglutamate synthase-like GNAT family acetyltransferase